MERTMNCPKCRGLMREMAGEFHCSACGMVLAPPRDAAASTATAVDSGRPAAAVAAAAASPSEPLPASAPPREEPRLPTAFYDPVEISLSARKPRSSGLAMEKNICFGINALHAVIATFGPYLFESRFYGVDLSGETSSMITRGAFFAGMLLAIGFALYEQEMLWKYACSGCMALTWIVIAYAWFAGDNLQELAASNLPAIGPIFGLLNGLLLLRLLWDAWFVSIVLRDAKSLRGAGGI